MNIMKFRDGTALNDALFKDDEYDICDGDKYSISSDLDLVVEVDLSDRGTSSGRWGTCRSRQSKYSQSLSGSSTGHGFRAHSSKPQSRSRPMKAHEVEPFLSIDTVPSAKKVEAGNALMMSASTAKPAPSSAGPVLTAYFSSYKPMYTPSEQRRSFTRADQLSAMSLTSVRGYTPYNSTKKTNFNIKAPFKHTLKNEVISEVITPPSPSHDIKERTAMATHHLKRVLSQERQNDKRKSSGKLQKGKLKPLKPVVMFGPTMNQCKGILSDKKIHISNPSDTLRRRINIVHNLPDMKEYLLERPQTEESIHRTSAASSIDGNRDNRIAEDFELDEDQMNNMIERQLSLNDVTATSDIGCTPRVPETSPRTKSSTPSPAEEAVNIVADFNVVGTQDDKDDSQSERTVDTPEMQPPPSIQIFIKKEKSLHEFSSQTASSSAKSPASRNSQKKRPHTACGISKSSGKVVRFAEAKEKGSGDMPTYTKTRPSTGGFTYISKKNDSHQKGIDLKDLMGQKKIVGRSCNPKSAFDENFRRDDDPDDDKENHRREQYFKTGNRSGSMPANTSSSKSGMLDNQSVNNSNNTQNDGCTEQYSVNNCGWCRKSTLHTVEKMHSTKFCDRFSNRQTSRVSSSKSDSRCSNCKSAPVTKVDKTSPPTSLYNTGSYLGCKVSELVSVRPSSAKVSLHVRNRTQESCSSHHGRSVGCNKGSMRRGHKCSTLLSSSHVENNESSEAVICSLGNSTTLPENEFSKSIDKFETGSQISEHPPRETLSAFDALNLEIDAIISDIKNKRTESSHDELSSKEIVIDSYVRHNAEKDESTPFIESGCRRCSSDDKSKTKCYYEVDIKNVKQMCSVIGELTNVCDYLKTINKVRNSGERNGNFGQGSLQGLLDGFTYSTLTSAGNMNKINFMNRIDKSDPTQICLSSTVEEDLDKMSLDSSLLMQMTSGTEQELSDKLIDNNQCTEMKQRSENKEEIPAQKPFDHRIPHICFETNSQPPPGYIFYFAYGLDMNPDRLQTYIHREKVERFWGLLTGFKMIFNKKGIAEEAGCFPNIQVDNFQSVEGCVYLITPDEQNVLNNRVGYPEHYQQLVLPVLILSNYQDSVSLCCVHASVYIANDRWICTDSPVPNEFALDQCHKNATTLRASLGNSLDITSANRQMLEIY